MEYIIVQAGGKGTRLGYLTKNKPKALVPVENLPMLFHLFRKYPDKRFVVIADYKKEVLHEYLAAFAEVKLQIVDAAGEGTCAGIQRALDLIPEKQEFMLIWSDLILPIDFMLPKEYEEGSNPVNDYVGISSTFSCRWSYINGVFQEDPSCEHGVAGFFLFTDKEKMKDVPESGELVRWMQRSGKKFREISLAGTREFGLLKEYRRMDVNKCRPFNRIEIRGNELWKSAIDEQGKELAGKEYAWYEKAFQLMASGGIRDDILPKVYGKDPLRMELIKGRNIFEYELGYEEKKRILWKLVEALQKLHDAGYILEDSFSVKEAYFNKTVDRLSKVAELIPFAKEKEIIVNGKKCRNVYFNKRELEKRVERLRCKRFCFIHGDCTFSNIMLRNDTMPVFIDPRGYFGFTRFYGDERYDWAKLYYSIKGNYDRFNLKDFKLQIDNEGVSVEIASNHWEDMECDFFEMTGADENEIKLIHAIIWLSLTTYAWQDYDSICGAFYNGLYYLEDVL